MPTAEYNDMTEGCKCPAESCKGGREQKDCCCFIARTRGPIRLAPCSCVNPLATIFPAMTYHDRNNVCLRCENGVVVLRG
jgi:hypothetical protein